MDGVVEGAGLTKDAGRFSGPTPRLSLETIAGTQRKRRASVFRIGGIYLKY